MSKIITFPPTKKPERLTNGRTSPKNLLPVVKDVVAVNEDGLQLVGIDDEDFDESQGDDGGPETQIQQRYPLHRIAGSQAASTARHVHHQALTTHNLVDTTVDRIRVENHLTRRKGKAFYALQNLSSKKDQ